MKKTKNSNDENHYVGALLNIINSKIDTLLFQMIHSELKDLRKRVSALEKSKK